MALYDAFVSYSHGKDKLIAAALQSAVQKLGKPWYKRRALRVFRDDTSLSATPQLWPSIERALGNSRYFILLASPEAAASKWVNKEVGFWIEHNSIETLLIGVTQGELAWNDDTSDFVRGEAMPLPPVLAGRFESEPKWVDLRPWREGADPRNAKFLEAGADFAAAIRGIPKEDLLSQEVRQQRRALMLAWSAAGSLLVLAGLTGWEWREAVAQRNRAEATLAAATETANGLITNLAVRFRNVTGVPSALIKDILDRARSLQEQLIGRGETSPELRRSQSRALNEAATTLSRLGDENAALDAATQAHGILQALLASEPDNMEWRRAFAASKERMADALNVLGKPDEALKNYRKAADILQSLISKDASNTMWQSQLADVLSSIGYFFRTHGRSQDALASYRRALAIREALVASEPNISARQLDLSISHADIGILLKQQGRLEEALASHSQEVEIAKKTTAREPTNLFAQKRVWYGTMHMGNVLKAQGKFDESVAAYRESRDLMQRLVTLDPDDADAERSLLDSEENIGDVLLVVRRLDDALAAYRRAHLIAEKLVQKDPTNVDWQRDLGVATAHIGDVLKNQDKLDDALAAFIKAKTVFEALRANDNAHAGWQESLSFVLYRIGDVYKEQGKFEQALEAYREHLAIAQAVAANEPNDSDAQRNLGIIHNRIGAVLDSQGKLSEALAAFRVAQEISKRITAADPTNNWHLRDLAVTYESVGNALLALEKPEEALAEYSQYVAVALRLVTRDQNPLSQRDLGLAYRKLGNAQTKLKKTAEAIESYSKSVDTFEQLAAAEPADLRAKRDLSNVYVALANVLEQEGRTAEAIEYRRKRLAVSEQLVAATPADTELQERLAYDYYSLGHSLKSSGKYAEAVANFNAGIVAAERLPQGPDGKYHVSVGLWSIGSVLEAQDRRDDALDYVRKTIALREEVVAAVPGNMDRLEWLANVYRHAGDLLLAMERDEEARVMYRKAFEGKLKVLLAAPNEGAKRNGMVEALFNLGKAGDDLNQALLRLQAAAEPIADKISGGVTEWLHPLRQFVAFRMIQHARDAFYGAHAQQALEELRQAQALAPFYGYATLWLHTFRERNGEGDAAELATNAKDVDHTKWPWPLIAHLLGQTTEQELRAQASDGENETTRVGQMCEADYFLGMQEIGKGARENGMALIKSAVEHCPKDYVEYAAAKLELAHQDSAATALPK
jgi:tetratricopeptide (TPR) repeat protein